MRRHSNATLSSLWLVLATSIAVVSCQKASPGAAAPTNASQPTKAAPPIDQYAETAPPDQREAPPPDGLTPDWSFPEIKHAKLPNGLELRVVERHQLPLAEVRLVVLSGQATDGDRAGLAAIAGDMLKAGGTGNLTSRALLDRVESLGASLEITTERDETRLSLAVTTQNLETAIGILADVAQQPRFSPEEFRKLKRREIDRVNSLARSSASWVSARVLYRELFQLPASSHPYAEYDATAKQLEKIQLADCKSWHKKHFTPANAFIVVSGDVNADTVQTAVTRAFGKWNGAAPPKPSFTAPLPPQKLSLFLVDRPDSTQAEVYVATLGPERQSAEFPSLKVANQVLGGGVAGRLFLDVREKRSLAYRTVSSLEEVANGPMPIVLSAGTQTAKAGLALKALLEHFDAMSNNAASESELGIATRYLSDTFLLSVETVSALGQMTEKLGVLALPDDYYDEYRRQVRAVGIPQAQGVASNFFRSGHAIIVVAGDAKRLSKPLSHFADVNVVDPERNFVTDRIVPRDPNASIELERVGGT